MALPNTCRRSKWLIDGDQLVCRLTKCPIGTLLRKQLDGQTIEPPAKRQLGAAAASNKRTSAQIDCSIGLLGAISALESRLLFAKSDLLQRTPTKLKRRSETKPNLEFRSVLAGKQATGLSGIV